MRGIILCLEAIMLVAVEMFTDYFQMVFADIAHMLEVGAVDRASLCQALHEQ